MTNTKNHITLQPAYVLHGKPYRDTSMLIEIFTPEYGRVGLVARGVRSAKSRTRSLLQPFRSILMSWNSKGDLGTLIGVEANAEEAGTYLTGRALMSGFYLNELLLRLLHRHDPHPALFNSYDLALRKLVEVVPAEPFALPCAHAVHECTRGRRPETTSTWTSYPAQHDVSLQQALRIFEKELLQDIGYGLVLDHDIITSQSIAAEGMYRYHLQKGPERIAPVSIINTLGIVMHGHSLLGLARNELHDAINLHEAKQLLRKALAVHLGQQPLRSRELYSEMLAGS